MKSGGGMKNKIEKIMKAWYHGKGVYDIEGIAFDIEELIDEECFKDRQTLKKEIKQLKYKNVDKLIFGNEYMAKWEANRVIDIILAIMEGDK
jgi:hypothetical protein